MRMHFRIVLSLLLLAASSRLARAQNFPADEKYRPLHCGHHVMTDGRTDEPAAIDERDLVGDTGHAAAWRAVDNQFLYLRLRLDKDAIPGGTITGFSWGVAFDTNNDARDYEVLALVDGVSGNVLLYRNTQTTTPDDATDPADTPAMDSNLATTHAKSTVAAGTSNGGDDDFFLSFAVPLDKLQSVGITPKTPVRVWVASSTKTNALDGDFACHSGGGVGHFSDVDSDRTVLDGDADSDGDGSTDADEVEAGTDPNNPDSHPGGSGELQLAGGGGCRVGVGGGGGAAGLALVLLLTGLVCYRRRRR